MAISPIMSPDAERYMAFEGVVRWAFSVIEQRKRIEAGFSKRISGSSDVRRFGTYSHLSDVHFFITSADMLMQHIAWSNKFSLFKSVDFSAVESFRGQDLIDLRNMHEHIVQYFQGAGREPGRWTIETPEYKADASSMIDTLIGGRLDYAAFADAVEGIMPSLLAEPIPYPT